MRGYLINRGFLKIGYQTKRASGKTPRQREEMEQGNEAGGSLADSEISGGFEERSGDLGQEVGKTSYGYRLQCMVWALTARAPSKWDMDSAKVTW